MKKQLLTLTILVLSVFGITSDIVAQPMCQAGFTFSIGTTNPNGSVTVFFQDSSFTAGNPPTYSWTFSDGQTSTLQNPAITFGGSGAYLACLTISSGVQGTICTSTYCDSIYVNVLPTCNAGFGWQQTSPGVVFFTGFTQNNASWTWDYGDGSTATGNNQIHTYAAPGIYNACLTVVTTSGQSCVTCQSVLVTGGSGCTAGFSAGQVPGTTTYNFTNTSSGSGALNYVWNFGDGTIDYSTSPSHTYVSGGVYNVCLTIYDSLAGCTDTYCDSLVINTFPGCYATFGFQTSPSGTFFVGPTQNNVSWAWDFGDGNTSTSQNPVHIYSNPGVYTVCLTVTTSNGATCSSCQNITIQSGSGCSSNFAIYPDTNALHTYVAYNLATGAGPLTYVWSWGDGTSSTGAYPSHTYAGPGVYTICLSIADANGCTSNTCYQFSLLRMQNAPVTVNVVAGTTGVAENEIIGAVTFAPNPATDNVTAYFNLNKPSNISITMSNLSGQVVFATENQSYTSGSHAVKMDISNLSKGIYMMQINSNGAVKHQKIVVQ